MDIEGVIRKLDPSGQDSLGPLDFVNALKWHDLPAGGAGEMRASFDAAAKRRKVAKSKYFCYAQSSSIGITLILAICLQYFIYSF